MNALYNEIEPFAADWLEQLTERGHVAPGRVERRSIADLTPADVAGPGQRHFFAGIGVWSAALRDAGVPDDANVWTGSCPCQPFSAAGSRGGTSDPRHLWPTWFALIEQCRPPIIFGEQVASKDGLVWLDLVFADLERCGYSVGAADLCAAGVGAPHIRQRLYFVAYANEARRGELGIFRLRKDGDTQSGTDANGRGSTLRMADANGIAGHEGRPNRGRGNSGGDALQRPRPRGRRRAGRLGDAPDEQCETRNGVDAGGAGATGRRRSGTGVAIAADFWSDCDWLPCIDGVARPVEPGTFPLAHGAPARVGRLRGYGNAIVRQVAATFIEAALDAIGEQ